MELERRIEAFARLGKFIATIEEEEKNHLRDKAKSHNGWFTQESVDFALEGILRYLDEEKIRKWLSAYPVPPENWTPRKVGAVMAGNIPLAGFHDALCILITGNILQAKLSSQDPFLPKYLFEQLLEIEPGFLSKIEITEKLAGFDAVIATGSDNSSRYFDYYFGKYPGIIRKNRTACAVISNNDGPEDFKNLGADVFRYFGLGCRNVSKLFVPAAFDFHSLIDAWKHFDHVMDNHKYANNYHYNRSIALVNQTPHLDSGFVLLLESEELVSPVSTIHYEYYDDPAAIRMDTIRNKLQCVVSRDGWFENSLPFGSAQLPELWHYADNIDTLDFLLKLNQ